MMASRKWRPLLYGLFMIGSCALTLTLTFAVILSINPEAASRTSSRSLGDLIPLIAMGVIAVTVPAAAKAFRRLLGRRFPDENEVVLSETPPTVQKVCGRCSESYWVHANEHHAAGFCSKACREAYARRLPQQPLD